MLVTIGANYTYNWIQTGTLSGNGFSESDIRSAEQSIREEYSKSGVAVTDVQLIRSSPDKLTGYVKVKLPIVGEVEKSCSASMGDNREYIWQCK